jgi:metal-dependent amidase/aminoacylase/carboxypeptidase family protein
MGTSRTRPEAMLPTVQSWGGDDFAWYLREVPGTFIRLGVHDPDSGRPHLDLHVGNFDVDERAISVGSAGPRGRSS